MRIIDADALITAFRKKWNDEHPVYEDTSGSMTYSEIIDFIRSFTIEPEQKKGEWLMKWNTFFHRELPACSECGTGSVFKTKFCHECGADMR